MKKKDRKTRKTVRNILEEEVSRVDSPETAEQVVRQLEESAEGETESERGEEVAHSAATPAEEIERAAQVSPTEREVANVLATTAAEAVAPIPEAPEVLEAAQEVFSPAQPPATPAVGRGRELLKEVTLRRMGPFQSLDARLYLTINDTARPRWLDSLIHTLTTLATGGWIWIGAILVARLLGAPKGNGALREIVPSMIGASLIVEYPVKRFFRRRRPFINIVRALVIGKRPGSWSFPSGHTASSFAGAWMLSHSWPRAAPLFYSLASLIGFSRIYVGAHYPSDVVSGAFLGVTLAETIREVVALAIGSRRAETRRLRRKGSGR